MKIKNNVCKNGHKTGVQEPKRLLKQQGGKNSPNKMKHNSPL